MGFSDLSTPAGLQQLDKFLVEKSYIEGAEPSQADVVVYKAVGSAPDSEKYANAARWYAHVTSYESKFDSLPGDKTASASSFGPESKEAGDDEDDEDVDLFGSDDEEEDAEAERVKQERLEAYRAKKAAKGPGPVAKSIVTLDVKPWDDETDLDAMLNGVKAIEMDGLVWGGHQFVAIGFGIKKLQINCVVEDAKVSMDDLQEEIEGLEDEVQSVDVQAMSKL